MKKTRLIAFKNCLGKLTFKSKLCPVRRLPAATSWDSIPTQCSGQKIQPVRPLESLAFPALQSGAIKTIAIRAWIHQFGQNPKMGFPGQGPTKEMLVSAYHALTSRNNLAAIQF